MNEKTRRALTLRLWHSQLMAPLAGRLVEEHSAGTCVLLPRALYVCLCACCDSGQLTQRTPAEFVTAGERAFVYVFLALGFIAMMCVRPTSTRSASLSPACLF